MWTVALLSQAAHHEHEPEFWKYKTPSALLNCGIVKFLSYSIQCYTFQINNSNNGVYANMGCLGR